jgi:hypothetical protein
MRRVKIALAAGLTLIAVAIGVTLSRAPLGVAGMNLVLNEKLTSTNRASSACQSNEVLPRGTSAIRIALSAFIGPRVTVKALSGKRVITHGARGSGWTGGVVTIPVRSVHAAISHIRICFAIALAGDETVTAYGEPATPTLAARSREGRPLPGRVRIEYLRPRRSWWSIAASVARRMGLGHAWSGTWIVFLAIALLTAVAALTSRLILRELR